MYAPRFHIPAGSGMISPSWAGPFSQLTQIISPNYLKQLEMQRSNLNETEIKFNLIRNTIVETKTYNETPLRSIFIKIVNKTNNLSDTTAINSEEREFRNPSDAIEKIYREEN